MATYLSKGKQVKINLKKKIEIMFRAYLKYFIKHSLPITQRECKEIIIQICDTCE